MLSIAVLHYASQCHNSTFREKGESNKYMIKPPDSPVKTERIQLDQMLKLLFKKYGEYELIEKEAFHMLKTVFDPKIWQDGVEKGIEQGIEQGIVQGKLEIAKNLLKQRMPIEMISEVTGLSLDEVIKLK